MSERNQNLERLIPIREVNDELPEQETPRTDRAIRGAKKALGVTGYTAIVLGVGAFLGAVYNMDPFSQDPSVPEQAIGSSPSPGVSAVISVGPSPKRSSASALPSKRASASATATASPSASRIDVAETHGAVSPSATVSRAAVSPGASLSERPSPSADQLACDPSAGAVICAQYSHGGDMVGYNNPREKKVIWNLHNGDHIVPECKTPDGAYILGDDESRPEGQQAAYVPAYLVRGAGSVALCS